MSVLHLLTPVTEIYTTSHVRLFDDLTSTYLAGHADSCLAESGFVTSRSAEQVFCRVPASQFSHLLESGLYGVEKGLSLILN